MLHDDSPGQTLLDLHSSRKGHQKSGHQLYLTTGQPERRGRGDRMIFPVVTKVVYPFIPGASGNSSQIGRNADDAVSMKTVTGLATA